MERLESAAELLRVLGEPTRLRLLALLARHGTLCVCELEAICGLPQYTVSRGLGILRRAGLARCRRNGARMDYELAELPAEVRAVLEAAVGLIGDDDQVRADAAALGRCCQAA